MNNMEEYNKGYKAGLNEAAKWIKENVSASVAVDFLMQIK